MMTSAFETHVQAIDKAMLEPIVRESEGSATLEVVDWRTEPISGGSTAAGVYRISGSAKDKGRHFGWSLVLKLLRPPAPGDRGMAAPSADPTRGTYWKREYLIYESGLFHDLPGGFKAPRCHLAAEQSGICWLWLEDLGEMAESDWTTEQFGIAARHLGSFNGVWLAQKELPSFSWLRRSHVRRRSSRMAVETPQFLAAAETLRQSPEYAAVWTDKVIARSCQLLADRESFLQALDRLPKTFLHQDAVRKNLVARLGEHGEAETVAIDWGFAGVGEIGGEVASLVVASARWFGLEPAQLPEVEEIALDGYLQGLYAAGWKGDPRLVRLGYLLTSTMLFAPDFFVLLSNADDRFRSRGESLFRRPFEEVVLNFSQVNRHVVDQADAARALLAHL